MSNQQMIREQSEERLRLLKQLSQGEAGPGKLFR